MKTIKQLNNQTISQTKLIFGALMAVAFVLRLILAVTSKGFQSDIACFSGWATRAFEGGLGSFYSPDAFTDYPPGYIYVLYVIGAILSTFHLDPFKGLGLILLKMPSILADMAAGYLIYRFGSKRVSTNATLLLTAAYLFNPAILLNSVVWGQVDSILVFFVVSFALLLSEGRLIPSAYVFAAGLLFKPQMLVFAPLLLFGIYEYEICGFTDWRRFVKEGLTGLGALVALLMGMLPFGIDKVLPQYTDTLGSYPYVSVNAYNFWALLGLNWASQDTPALGTITYQQLGTINLVLLTLISAVIFVFLQRKQREERYFVTGAFLIITTFMFSVRMHERYLYPALLLLAFSYLYSRQRAYVWAYIIVSAAHFLNVWHVLYHYDPSTYYDNLSDVYLLSAITVVGAVLFYGILIRTLKGGLKESAPASKLPLPSAAQVKADFVAPLKPAASRTELPFTKTDFIIIAAITLIYGIVAFVNLGYNKAPQTHYSWAASETIHLEFPEDKLPTKYHYYLRNQQQIDYTLNQMDQWGVLDSQTHTMKNVFTWGEVVFGVHAPITELVNSAENVTLGELVFLDDADQVITPLNAADYPELFDEADTLPATFDHLSGTYFDEIYYHRTAYEFMEGLPSYENTHPPLGKSLMALGAEIFGTTPFGFRCVGTLFGVMMLPFLYLLARNLTENRFIGAVATIAFAFDFMHFTQTRISTIDVYIVFFIIVMYYFMERYLRMSFYDTDLRKTFIPLGACGIAFGLGVSSKWTGMYAGAGLAILFFWSLYKRYREYLFAIKTPKASSNGISHQYIIKNFAPNTIRTILFCLGFFVAIPLTIYVLSYIPFRDYSGSGLLKRAWDNQITMYSYHSQLEFTHAYSSRWYEWPTMIRPVFYFCKTLPNGLTQGISAFGNPAVWYPAIPAAIYTLYLAIFKKNSTAGFLSVGLAAQFLPWMLVSRCTFLYHYFPSVPFLVLMIAFCLSQLKKRMKPQIFYPACIIYCLVVVGLFAMFYPVLSGVPVTHEYVDTYLRWMDSWVLVI